MLDRVFKRLPIKECYFVTDTMYSVTDTTSNFKMVILQNENSTDIDIFHRETSFITGSLSYEDRLYVELFSAKIWVCEKQCHGHYRF